MTHISRWAQYLVIGIILFAVLMSTPNFLPVSVRNATPNWLPKSTVNLGLDLQGGSYLLLEVDFAGVNKERLETLQGDIRVGLRKERIGYTGLDIANNAVNLRITDSARVADARKILNMLAAPNGTLLGVGTREYDLTEPTPGQFVMTLSPSYVTQMQSVILSQSIEVVRRRIDELGTREPAIQRQGNDRILVQVPGLTNPEQLKTVLSTTAKMSFRMVDTTAIPDPQNPTRVPPGDDLLYEIQKDGTKAPYVVERRVLVSGDRLTNANGGFDSRTGEPVVNFRFDTRGAKQFGDATKVNVGKPFAIILDDKVISAPRINEPILGGSGQISGSFTIQTANDLAILLNAGALPASLKVIEERTVGAELGADSVVAGEWSAAFGLLAVAVFMIATYGLFGVFATLALAVNVLLLLALLTTLGATLTLPGIAGMVLTMGMAVDANVLIYERIREEMRSGKTIIAAIDAGFRRAIATIIDTNMTHIVAALILFQLGTGPVRGFAVTLGLGVATSFFTAVMVTRFIVLTWLRAVRPKTLNL